MFERRLGAFKNGVTYVETKLEENEIEDDTDEDQLKEAVTVTVGFAVMTDTEAWMHVSGAGKVHPAFGGTGTTPEELDEYAAHAISIYRAVTGDEDTDFIYPHGEPINTD